MRGPPEGSVSVEELVVTVDVLGRLVFSELLQTGVKGLGVNLPLLKGQCSETSLGESLWRFPFTKLSLPMCFFQSRPGGNSFNNLHRIISLSPVIIPKTNK